MYAHVVWKRTELCFSDALSWIYWSKKYSLRGRSMLGPGFLELEFESAEEAVEDGEEE